jgi:hypothetical protein
VVAEALRARPAAGPGAGAARARARGPARARAPLWRRHIRTRALHANAQSHCCRTALLRAPCLTLLAAEECC